MQKEVSEKGSSDSIRSFIYNIYILDRFLMFTNIRNSSWLLIGGILHNPFIFQTSFSKTFTNIREIIRLEDMMNGD